MLNNNKLDQFVIHLLLLLVYLDYPSWLLLLGKWTLRRSLSQKLTFSALPLPVHATVEEVEDIPLPVAPTVHIPPYGKRKGWKPKAAAEFGGGGAYPEVRDAYPEPKADLTVPCCAVSTRHGS